MKLKASLHIHTKEDFVDGYVVRYNIYELIDYAAKNNFKILALTGHKKFIYRPEFGKYAEKKGIILVPGVELHINRFLFLTDHIIVLNCGKDVEKIKNINDLLEYRKANPEIFVLAPHPGFGFLESISINKLIKNIDLFDGFEHSWFYSKKVNLNKKVVSLAKKFNKPLVATADAHILTYFNTDYAIIDAEYFSSSSVLDALRRGRVANVTSPKSIFSIAWYIIRDMAERVIKYPVIKI
jgi:predicted metal-dependent phosphoesterase TrpH